MTSARMNTKLERMGRGAKARWQQTTAAKQRRGKRQAREQTQETALLAQGIATFFRHKGQVACSLSQFSQHLR